jgi:hypothetical protein
MRPSLSSSSYSFVHGETLEETFILTSAPRIKPSPMVFLEDEPKTTPGVKRWVPCPNCNGLDLTDADEVCPTCDNRRTILTIQKVSK